MAGVEHHLVYESAATVALPATAQWCQVINPKESKAAWRNEWHSEFFPVLQNQSDVQSTHWRRLQSQRKDLLIMRRFHHLFPLRQVHLDCQIFRQLRYLLSWRAAKECCLQQSGVQIAECFLWEVLPACWYGKCLFGLISFQKLLARLLVWSRN